MQSRIGTDLLARDDLSICLLHSHILAMCGLHLGQHAREIPESRLGDHVVAREDLHLVQRGIRVLLRWQLPPDHDEFTQLNTRNSQSVADKSSFPICLHSPSQTQETLLSFQGVQNTYLSFRLRRHFLLQRRGPGSQIVLLSKSPQNKPDGKCRSV